MLYSSKHNAVLYNLTDPERVLSIIPEAKRMSGSVVAIPHTLRNGQIMAYLGYPALSTIETDYTWPCRFAGPRPQQRIMAGFHTLHQRCVNVSEMRVGKTLATLWASDFLMGHGSVQKALIISPLSTLKRVWEDEIFTSFHGKRTATILHGDRAKRMKELAKGADFSIINFDGVGIGTKHTGHRFELGPLAQELIARKDINLIIIDEISALKNGASLRWKIINKIIESKPECRLWGLTGTPAANAPTDAHAIARLVYGRSRKPESFQSFRQRTMYRVSEFKWMPAKGAEQAVNDLLQPAIRYSRKDLGLPPLSYETRDVPLSKTQEEAYRAMRKDLQIMTTEGKRIDAVNEAVLRTKLMQISAGAVYGPDREVHHVDARHRLEALDEILDEADGKILVFCSFKHSVHMIRSHLHKTVECEVINGDVGAGERNRIIGAFQASADGPRVLILDPRSAGHGLNLSMASTVVWFSPVDSLEVYEQASSRIIGPENCGTIIHLSSTPVEKEIYKRLQEKKTLQGAILDLLRGE